MKSVQSDSFEFDNSRDSSSSELRVWFERNAITNGGQEVVGIAEQGVLGAVDDIYAQPVQGV